MDDPDAPMDTWVHWVVYNIPNTITGLDENTNIDKVNAISGTNGWIEKGYGGACPPDGTHRYNFKLYALDYVLPPNGSLMESELMNAIKGHVLGVAILSGLFRGK